VGMHFWIWESEEMLDLIEWMRAFNKAPGLHPALSFTSFDMQYSGAAAEKALDYLRQYAPDQAGPAAAAYAEAQDLDSKRTPFFDDRARAAADRAAAVLKVFDSKRSEWIPASSPESWRAARQAAAIVLQACTMRIPGKSAAYRDEAMAANVEWLAASGYPGEKIVLCAHNGHVAFGAGVNGLKPMGSWLRERFGKQLYVAGFTFRRGEVRAIGTRDLNTAQEALGAQTAPPSPEGSGDAILSAAGLPLFFLDMTRLPAGPLGRWLAEPHLFHYAGWNWSLDDPGANYLPAALSTLYDGLIFVEEGHAARPMPLTY